MSGRRAAVRVLGGLAAVLGALAATVSSPTHPAESPVANASAIVAPAERERGRVTARELAEWIRAGKSGLRVLDLRGASAFEAQHIPSAEAVGFSALDTIPRRAGETLVVYSDDDVRDAQAWAWLHASGHRRAYVVDGGLAAWMAEVIDPVVRGDSADHVAALSRYFGGVPRAVQPSAPASPPRPRSVPSPSVAPASMAADELGFVGRRGC